MNRYDSRMAGEIAVRKLSPEFWAFIGSAVALLMALIGIAISFLIVVAGWDHEDIRRANARVTGLEISLNSETNALDAKVAAMDRRLAVLENRVLPTRPSVAGENSEET